MSCVLPESSAGPLGCRPLPIITRPNTKAIARTAAIPLYIHCVFFTFNLQCNPSGAPAVFLTGARSFLPAAQRAISRSIMTAQLPQGGYGSYAYFILPPQQVLTSVSFLLPADALSACGPAQPYAFAHGFSSRLFFPDRFVFALRSHPT